MTLDEPRDLLDVYRIAVEEYRFEVQLGWDRTKYFLIFNSAIVSVGTGLLSLEESGAASVFAFLVFVSGFVAVRVGIKAVETSHNYYRRAVFKKTLIEDLLGLASPVDGYAHDEACLALGTTSSQAKRLEILHDTKRWITRPVRKDSVVFMTQRMLKFLALIDLAGAIFAASRLSLYLPEVLVHWRNLSTN